MTVQPYSIRDATDLDREALIGVTLAAYQHYAQVFPPAFWEGYRSNILARVSEEGPAERIVAEHAGVLLGSVLLYPPSTPGYGRNAHQGAWPEIRLLAVTPEARGQGIGRALTEECLRRSRHRGSTTIGLHTMDAMATALQMYERMGFVRDPDSDFTPTQDILVKGYRLDLTSVKEA